MPGLAAINYTDSSDQSSFNGATFSLRTNRADLQVSAAYTIGKATDYSSSFSAASRPDPYGPASQDEGPADFDVRHKLSASVNWKLPGPSKDGPLKMVLGGWQLGVVGVAQSGNPFTVTCGGSAFVAIRDAAGNIVGNSGCDYNADGFGPDRPNAPSFGSTIGHTNDDFINGVFKKADFATPAPGQPGTLGRNTFVGPRYVNVDMVLLRSVRFPSLFGNSSSAQFRLEMFNALNNTNLIWDPGSSGTLTSPLFGKATSALPGRIVQFSLRFAF